MKRILPFIIILLVLGVAVGSAFYLKQSSTGGAAVLPPPTTSGSISVNNPANPGGGGTIAQNPATETPGAEPAHVLGPASAPAKLEEFGDFECPPCGLLHPILVQMKSEFGDQLQITFREYPLTQLHPHAVAAASSAEAAGLQGKFWEMHDQLYEHQKDWHEAFDVRPIFEGYAKQIGLDVAQFQRDVNSNVVGRRITADGSRGHAFGVKGTPTVFLNGKEVPFDQLPAEKLRVLIKAAITNSK
jgi:protein-disulfide isomerase